MKKDFSVLKWFVFPLLVAGCAIGIVHASYTMFGFDGTVLYAILLFAIVFISLILVLQTGNKLIRAAMIAAFAFETVGLIALLITSIVAIQASRELAGMRAASTSTNTTIETIAKLKSSKAQNTLVKNATIVVPDIGKATADAEKKMLWPLVFEAGIYVIGLVVVFGINLFYAGSVEKLSQPFNPSNARLAIPQTVGPLRSFTQHTLNNGAGFFLSLSPSGIGKSIRFRERGSQAIHVLRVSQTVVDRDGIESFNYQQLAEWTLKALRDTGKDGKPVYKKIEASL